MTPGAWRWPVGVVRAARRRLGLLPDVSGAEVVAAAGVTTADVPRRYGLRSAIGWGAAG